MDEVNDDTPLFFPCDACGAGIGKSCVSNHGKEVRYNHRVRRNRWHFYFANKRQGNTSQVEHCLKLRNEYL